MAINKEGKRVAGSTKSCKAKARKLQNWVRDQLVKLGAQPSAIKVALMGEAGADVICGNFAIECANQEKLNIWKKVEQAERNALALQVKSNKDYDFEPVVVFKKNQEDPYVAIRSDFFFYLMSSTVTLTKLGIQAAENAVDDVLKCREEEGGHA